jgi:hypothetical protein
MERETPMTVAPAARKALVTAVPKPPLAPVMSAFLFVSIVI